jgi:hypothetical protein
MLNAAEQKTSGGDEFGMLHKKLPSSGRVRLRKSILALKSRKHAILKPLIHVPSMAITWGVLSLTFMHVFWEPPTLNTNPMASRTIQKSLIPVWQRRPLKLASLTIR